MSNLTEHRTIMRKHEFQKNGRDYVYFEQEPDAIPELQYLEGAYIKKDIYEEMGSPEVITVSIKPGDHLNDSDGD